MGNKEQANLVGDDTCSVCNGFAVGGWGVGEGGRG
jgi:hypothetical protein